MGGGPSQIDVRDNCEMSWQLVGGRKDVEIPDALLPAASSAAPLEVLDAMGELLPRRRPDVEERCRLCGGVDDLTREHLPPKASGNSGRLKAYDLNDWFGLDELERFSTDLRGGRTHQGGNWAYLLCGGCNIRTGKLYGAEYAGWAGAARNILAQVPPPREIDQETTARGVDFELIDVHPGKFIRQALSIMCSLSGAWDLADEHPVIKVDDPR